jgi:hypothetical protein
MSVLGRFSGRRGGYVLVMVLALLVLAATLLVAVSRAAGRSALVARSAEDDLQHRWGVVSCRKAVLPYIETILTSLEQERRRPVARFDMAVRLGSYTFDLILADEQAKANVNAMLEEADATRAETRIRQGLSGSGLGNRIRLRPTVGEAVVAVRATATTAPTTRPTRSAAAPAVASWGQVFDDVPPGQLLRPIPGGRLAPVDLLTSWGGGAMNVRRASDAALTLAAGRSLTGAQIGRLIDARDKLWEKRTGDRGFDESPAEKLKALITKTIGESLRNKGNLGLIEGSTCHSLWVITRSGRRDWYDAFVSEESEPQRPVVWTFSW